MRLSACQQARVVPAHLVQQFISYWASGGVSTHVPRPVEHNQPILANKLLDRSPDRVAADAVLALLWKMISRVSSAAGVTLGPSTGILRPAICDIRNKISDTRRQYPRVPTGAWSHGREVSPQERTTRWHANGNTPRRPPQMIMSLGASGSKPQLRSSCGRLHTSSSPTGVTGASNPKPPKLSYSLLRPRPGITVPGRGFPF